MAEQYTESKTKECANFNHELKIKVKTFRSLVLDSGEPAVSLHTPHPLLYEKNT